jgi:hypothetical protein
MTPLGCTIDIIRDPVTDGGTLGRFDRNPETLRCARAQASTSTSESTCSASSPHRRSHRRDVDDLSASSEPPTESQTRELGKLYKVTSYIITPDGFAAFRALKLR